MEENKDIKEETKKEAQDEQVPETHDDIPAGNPDNGHNDNVAPDPSVLLNDTVEKIKTEYEKKLADQKITLTKEITARDDIITQLLADGPKDEPIDSVTAIANLVNAERNYKKW